MSARAEEVLSGRFSRQGQGPDQNEAGRHPSGGHHGRTPYGHGAQSRRPLHRLDPFHDLRIAGRLRSPISTGQPCYRLEFRGRASRPADGTVGPQRSTDYNTERQRPSMLPIYPALFHCSSDETGPSDAMIRRTSRIKTSWSNGFDRYAAAPGQRASSSGRNAGATTTIGW